MLLYVFAWDSSILKIYQKYLSLLQGPLVDTFAAFWRMCWEVRSASVVMMTRLEERARIKCDQYWPTRGSDTYGGITVTAADVQELATYCVRTFHLNKVTHF
jgi:receptor-type tyrosine-protein phosphatase F